MDMAHLAEGMKKYMEDQPDHFTPTGINIKDIIQFELSLMKEIQDRMRELKAQGSKLTQVQIHDTAFKSFKYIMGLRGKEAKTAMMILVDSYVDRLDDHAKQVNQILDVLTHLGEEEDNG